MAQWFMLTLVGQDRLGIVAQVTTALYEGGCNLGEASMMRLGGNFSILLMVHYQGNVQTLTTLLEPAVTPLNLHFHVDAIEGQLHQHQPPEIRISVHGADRAGIVAQVTTVLAKTGFNIVNLESDVGGNEQQPFYIMHIEGIATQGVEIVKTALQQLQATQSGLDVYMEPIETWVM